MKNFTLPTSSLDPCSIGPLTCGPINCDGVTHDDENTTTLFSAATRKGRVNGTFRGTVAKSNSTVSSVSLTPLEQLKRRVSDFQVRGWLSQQEHRKYMALLDTAPRGKQTDTTDYVLQELAKELDFLEDRMTGGTASFSKQVRQSVLTPRRRAAHTQKGQESQAPVQPSSSSPFGDLTNYRGRKSELIMDVKDLAKKLSKKEVEDLFVETCFFARLGFVQPPCCLQCTYCESLKDAYPESQCSRWVVWRRDANHILHPQTLKENTIFVQCHVARDLLAGRVIDSHKWDSVKKVLLFPRPH